MNSPKNSLPAFMAAAMAMARFNKNMRRLLETRPDSFQIWRNLSTGKFGGHGNWSGTRYPGPNGPGERARRLRQIEKGMIKVS